MVGTWRRAGALVVSTVLGATLAGCGSDDSGADAGTLTVLHHQPYESADPQRIYVGAQLAHFRRLVYRSLVAFPMSEDEVEASTPVPDLATDTGTSRRGGREWSFTLKDGVTWEDGSELTCEDVRYGTSRSFATDVITGGPTYMVNRLDVPRDRSGRPVYRGPYSGVGQRHFDRAVTCEDDTITFRFAEPWVDFPLAVAATMMVDPYRESEDQGARSQWRVFSNGPYRVEGGEWSRTEGATLVRNEEYDSATDSPEELRRALPDRIEMVVEASETAGELFNERLIEDAPADRRSITIARVGPAQLPRLTGDVARRYVRSPSPFTGFLVPNTERLDDVAVRRALALATDTEGWVTALGGERVAEPSENLVNPSIPGWTELDAFSGSNSGDPETARDMLRRAGVRTPVPLKVAYLGGPTTDKAMAALKAGWDAAGFETTLDPLGATYYDVISRRDDEYDLTWAGWAADWPTMAAVLPPLFDSRPNFSPGSCGQNFGCYQSEEFETLVDRALAATDVEEQTRILQEANEVLARDVAYIPLEVSTTSWVHGSEVTGFTVTAASNHFPEIGLIGVED
ncbi:ABC transporter substrate-binding protein [Nocardioides sp. Y6]|uniref:ABC transporter substrate-binding protein n=1 Tax=Nocardioides malaquae TaxID=2773426 RepID=A0ABR9RRY6_9ACTN|nr:ABC transporter substrate-binding protein [Nocardioides malaquae]MBE7324326.1 ABC transporter substrate-binding protein [Nocardioides malaquae]